MEANDPQIVSPGLEAASDEGQGVSLAQPGENPEPARLENSDAVPGDQAGIMFGGSVAADGAETPNHEGKEYGDLSDPDVQLEVYQNEIEGLERDGKGYKGLCPLHSDHEPSLRINLKDGKWLWFCHPCETGGNAFELLKRLGKPPRAPKKDGERKAQPIIYEYTDKDGQLLFQALRYGDGKGKTFKQRRPDGKGDWIWSVPEDLRTLYNFPEVTKAEQIFIVEGEKDVETARTLGLTATTNPLGATKWLPRYSELLAGKNVVLIPDNDKAGDKHRYVVLKSLCEASEHPTSIKVVRLPKGKDLTEWVEAGGKVTQLNELVDQAEKFAYVDEKTGNYIVAGKLEDPERDYEIIVVCKSETVAFKYRNLGLETVVWQKDDEDRISVELAGKKAVLTFLNEAVVAALLAEVQSLKVVTALPKSADEFVEWVDAAPERRIRLVVSNADVLIDEDIPPREVLMQTKSGNPIFFKQSINQLFAWRGSGKTYVALGIVKALVVGSKFLDWSATRPLKVLYVEGEIPAYQMQERIRQVVGKSNGNLRVITLDKQPDNEIPSLKAAYGRKLVEEAIGDADVLVLDSISTLFNFGTNEEDPWLDIAAWMRKLRSKGMCIIYLHHSGKTGLQRGASKSEDPLDVSIKLQQPNDYRIEEGLRVNLRFDKTRGVVMTDGDVEVAMVINDDRAEFFGRPIGKEKKEKESDRYEEAVEYFEENPNMSTRKLAKLSGIPKTTLGRYKARWLEELAEEDGAEGSPQDARVDPGEKSPRFDSKPGPSARTRSAKKPPASVSAPLADVGPSQVDRNERKSS